MASLQPILTSALGSLKMLLWSKKFLIPVCGICAYKLLHSLNSYFSMWSLNNFISDESWDWTREIVLITGGSNGIGADMVRKFSKSGVKVVIWDVVAPSPDLLENSSVSYYHVDVTSEKMIVETAKQLRADVGAPSVLINNAGIAFAETILNETMEQRKRVFDVNVLAQMRLVQEFLPDMTRRNHGHVVTMATIMAFHEGLGQELRMRYNARRVRTTIVHPHFVRTGMIGKLVPFDDFPEFLLKPDYVADEVVKQVMSGYAGRIVLPPSNFWLARLRALPPWYMYYIHSLEVDVYKPRT